MDKSIVYYTDNRISGPIIDLAQKYILQSGFSVVSCSLKPINFGQNIVVEGYRSYPTMIKQIITALEASTSKYVFFCEHDVLYHKSHFDFTPPTDELYYYNINNWRWDYPKDRAIQYDDLSSLSQLCCNRQMVLNHYLLRREKIKEWGLDEGRIREPRWARLWGYEPGTKKKSRGGFTDEDFGKWRSEYPNVDIRHRWTFSKPKTTLDSFKHQPTGWLEVSLDKIPGWDLKGLFNL